MGLVVVVGGSVVGEDDEEVGGVSGVEYAADLRRTTLGIPKSRQAKMATTER